MKAYWLFAVLFVTSCTTSPAYVGVDCGEGNGVVDEIHLSQEDIAHGFPYTINAYMPACYEEESDREYPILYLFPGRSSGPATWFNAGLADVVDDLIAGEQIPPLIIVTLENVEGDLMATNFWENIFPYVEAHYRILDGAQYHAIGGASMGGAPAYRMALQYPDTFGSMALFGSGVIHGEQEQVREWLGAIPDAQLPRTFLNTGLQDALLVPFAQELEQILGEFGAEAESLYTTGIHAYTYWVTNFDEYLIWLAEGW